MITIRKLNLGPKKSSTASNPHLPKTQIPSPTITKSSTKKAQNKKKTHTQQQIPAEQATTDVKTPPLPSKTSAGGNPSPVTARRSSNRRAGHHTPAEIARWEAEETGKRKRKRTGRKGKRRGMNGKGETVEVGGGRKKLNRHGRVWCFSLHRFLCVCGLCERC